MLIHTIRRRPAIICREREHAPTSSCRRWRAAMATLIVKHKRLMSKWTQRGGGNTHKQTQFFHREEVATVRICGHHYWLSFAEFDNIAASGHMMLVAVQVQCLPRDAMPAAQCNALASKMAADMPTKNFGTTIRPLLIRKLLSNDNRQGTAEMKKKFSRKKVV